VSSGGMEEQSTTATSEQEQSSEEPSNITMSEQETQEPSTIVTGQEESTETVPVEQEEKSEEQPPSSSSGTQEEQSEAASTVPTKTDGPSFFHSSPLEGMNAATTHPVESRADEAGSPQVAKPIEVMSIESHPAFGIEEQAQRFKDQLLREQMGKQPAVASSFPGPIEIGKADMQSLPEASMFAARTTVLHMPKEEEKHYGGPVEHKAKSLARITVRNESTEEVEVDGKTIPVGSFIEVGKYATHDKHAIRVCDRNGKTLLDQNVFLKDKGKHLALLNTSGGGFSLRKINKVGFPMDGDINVEEEEFDLVLHGDVEQAGESTSGVAAAPMMPEEVHHA